MNIIKNKIRVAALCAFIAVTVYSNGQDYSFDHDTNKSEVASKKEFIESQLKQLKDKDAGNKVRVDSVRSIVDNYQSLISLLDEMYFELDSICISQKEKMNRLQPLLSDDDTVFSMPLPDRGDVPRALLARWDLLKSVSEASQHMDRIDSIIEEKTKACITLGMDSKQEIPRYISDDISTLNSEIDKIDESKNLFLSEAQIQYIQKEINDRYDKYGKYFEEDKKE